MVQIDPFKKYNKIEIMDLLEFDETMLLIAEEHKMLVFFDGSMYGVNFFQFLRDNNKRLEHLQISLTY